MPASGPRLTDAVLAHLREATKRLDPKLRGPKDCASNRKMVANATKREGADLEEWKAVIDAQYDSVRADPEKWCYLCLSTITRPKNWARLRDAPRRVKPAEGGSGPAGRLAYNDMAARWNA